MSDPKRWSDEGGGGTADERALLESGRDVRMPAALRKRVWLGIAAGVGASAGAAAGGAAAGSAIGQGTTAKGTLSLLLSGTAAKAVLAVALLGGAGAGVHALRSTGRSVAPADDVRTATREKTAPEPTEVPAAPDPRPGIERAPAVDTAEASGPVPEHEPRTPGAARRASKSIPAQTAAADDVAPPQAEPAPEARATSRLREESAAVVAARKTLLAGNPAEALRMLDRLRADYPNGALVQEREALTIRALVESGQKEAARKRAEAFFRAYPRSPHAAEVRALLGP
jgi:hypothetical protein